MPNAAPSPSASPPPLEVSSNGALTNNKRTASEIILRNEDRVHRNRRNGGHTGGVSHSVPGTYHGHAHNVTGYKDHRQQFVLTLPNIVVLMLFFLANVQNILAQEIGVDICSCAPSTYEFTLDFSLFCPPVNVPIGEGVAETSCLISPFGDPENMDLTPVAVQSIDILELNQNLAIVAQENFAGSFGDDDTFMYTSYVDFTGNIVSPEVVPRAIQVTIVGVNRNDQPIINVFLILFTNSCTDSPVLFEGQSAGWARLSKVGLPKQRLCPLVSVPESSSPSLNPSAFPSSGPSTMPSGTPSAFPTATPTLSSAPVNQKSSKQSKKYAKKTKKSPKGQGEEIDQKHKINKESKRNKKTKKSKIDSGSSSKSKGTKGKGSKQNKKPSSA